MQTKASIYENLGQQVTLQTIIEQSYDIVDLLNKATIVQSENKSKSPVHGVQHVRNVLLLANFLGLQNNISENDLAILREAAIYHDRCHKKAGHKEHAKEGADFYLHEAESEFDFERKEEVAFLIEAHEYKSVEQIEELINNRFTNITEERRKELVFLALILQDADRLDMLRYDIEKGNWQRFDPSRLNNPENARFISAVIELNTRQAIATGFLKEEDFAIEHADKKNMDSIETDLLKLYFEKGTTYSNMSSEKEGLRSKRKETRFNDGEYSTEDEYQDV